jgi:hypothetical protein
MVVGMDRTPTNTGHLLPPRSGPARAAHCVLIADRRHHPGKAMTPETVDDPPAEILLSLGRRLVAAAERSIARNAERTRFAERAAAARDEDSTDDRFVARAA